MENLFEELKRIKSLMIYEQGANIYEVSTSSAGANPENPGAGDSADSGTESEVKSNVADDPGKKVKKNCVSITNTERYNTESDVNTEVPEKFFQKFKAKVEEQFGLFEDGEFTLEDINVFGGASNYWRGSSSNKFPAVEPKYCNEYDVNVGIKSLKPWGAGCKGYNKTPKATYDKNSAGKKKNEDLAKRRAEKVLKELTTKIITYAKEKNIKVPENYESEIKSISSGSIYSLDKTDTHGSVSAAINSGELNAGQFVMIDAVLCFTPNEPCPKCMVKDPQTKKCKCKEGLTEKDGKCYCPNGKEADENCECNSCPDPCMKFNKETKKCECPEGMTYNEETKQCECPKGFIKNENCECIKGKEEETCPDKCMKRDADGKCKCPEGMTYNEQTKVCDCPEGKIKPTADACNCTTPKPPLKCNYEAKKEGARGTKQNNFVAASLKSSFPAGAGNKLTISFDSLVVPDAFYIKYGDQEFFSGFMGDVWNPEYKQVAFSDDERKKMLYIQPKSSVDYIQATNDEDFSSINNRTRNFVGELIYYKRKEDLLGSINAAIKSEGGKLAVTDIFKNGDSDGEKITDQIRAIDIKISGDEREKNIGVYLDQYKKLRDSYGNIMKTGASFTINKETENLDIVVLVFSPLDRTIFNISVKCE